MMRQAAVADRQVGAPAVRRALLLRYRALALTTAVLLVILVFVGIPLQFAAGRPAVMSDVGTAHGFLYLAYIFAAFQLTRRLGIPKWQMLLVLLAGTVPFAGFVAERKMTKRFEAARKSTAPGSGTIPPAEVTTGAKRTAGAGTSGQDTSIEEPPQPAGRRRDERSVYARWMSRRAVLLHLEVAVVAPACLAAGWWQVRSALGGNGLSWVYAVEWPVFATLAVAGWWYLIHEDPDVYRARKQAPSRILEPRAAEPAPQATIPPAASRLATVLAWSVGVELVLGMVELAFPRSSAVALAHGVAGLPLVFGSMLLLALVRGAGRAARISGWSGIAGTLTAGAGGLLAAAHVQNVAGVLLMLVGAVVAGFGYLVPTLERMS